MLSYGPDIQGAHSPDERVRIPTVEKMWDLHASRCSKTWRAADAVASASAAGRWAGRSGPALGPRPGRSVPQPRLVRGLPVAGARGSRRAARAAGSASRSRFLVRECEPLLDAARAALAAFVGARPDGSGLRPQRHHRRQHGAAVARARARATSCSSTDHEYNACRNALDFVAARRGARVVVGRRSPSPSRSPDEVVDARPRARDAAHAAALVDHVTSPTGARPAGGAARRAS